MRILHCWARIASSMEGIIACQPLLLAAPINELLVSWQDIFQIGYRMFRGILNRCVLTRA